MNQKQKVIIAACLFAAIIGLTTIGFIPTIFIAACIAGAWYVYRTM